LLLHPDPGRRPRRKQDPQLARIYHTRTVERGAEHLQARCVVAGAPAERAWAVLNRQMPDVVCDTDGVPVTPAPAKPLITDNDQRADPGPPPIVAAPRHAPGTGRRSTHTKKGEGPQQAAPSAA